MLRAHIVPRNYWLSLCIAFLPSIPCVLADTGTITIQLRDSSAQSLPITTTEGSIDVECSFLDGSSSEQATINSGEDSATLTLTSGITYLCGAAARAGYIRSVPQQITLSSGATDTMTVTYQVPSRALTFNFIDKTSSAYPLTGAEIGCGNLGIRGSAVDYYTVKVPAGSSSVTVPFEAGSYGCFLSVPDNLHSIPQTRSVRLGASQNESLTYTLLPDDSTLTISVIDSNGNPILMTSQTRSSVYCTTEVQGTAVSYDGQIQTNQNSITFNVLGGQTYSCRIASKRNNFRGGIITVPVSVGENKSASITFADRTATILAKLVDLSGLPVTAPSGFSEPSIGCRDQDSYGGTATGRIAVGASEVSLNAERGRYLCGVSNLAGYWSEPNPSKVVFTTSGSTVEYPIVVTPLNSQITLEFKDQSNNPLSVPADSSYPELRCASSKEELNETLVTGTSSKTLNVLGGATYTCTVDGFNGYAAGSETFSVGTSETKSVPIAMRAKNVTMNVDILASNGTPYTSRRNTEGRTFSSSYPNFSSYDSVLPGASTASIKVVGGGNYSCSMNVPGRIATNAMAQAPASGSLTTHVALTEPNATVVARLVDPNGTVLAGAENWLMELESRDSSTTHNFTIAFMNGIATAQLKAGIKYHFWTHHLLNDTIGPSIPLKVGNDMYYVKEPFAFVTPSSGAPLVKDFVAARINATIAVSTSTNRGQVRVQAVSSEDSFLYASISNGSASIDVPAGTYDVTYYGAGASLAQRKRVTVQSGMTAPVTFTTQPIDLVVRTLITGPGSPSGTVQCNAFSPSGGALSEETGDIGGTLHLPVSSQMNAWTIRCQAWSESTGKRYDATAPYTVPDPLPASGFDDITINLTERGEIKSQAVTSSSNTDLEVPIDNKTRLTVPSKTFGANKVVTVEVSNKASAPETDTVSPIEVFSFTAKESTATVSATQDVTFTVPIGTGQSVYTFTKSQGYVQRDKTLANSLSAQDSVLSGPPAYDISIPKDVVNEGVVVIAGIDSGNYDPTPTPTPEATATPKPQPPAADNTPSAPTKLVVTTKKDKSRKAYTVTASWKSPTSTVTSYKVELLRAGKPVASKTAGASKTPKVSFSKVKAGTYVVKVQAVNSGAVGASVQKTVKLK